nr:MAG: ORF1 [TTV-like mini virus]
MAYYFRNFRRPWWRRRKRFYWRRNRRPFRKHRRRHRRVRKKLKFLPLKQWQPSHIRKLCIKGMYCLFECNHKLLTHNYTQYHESISPEGIPLGGGFSINRFTLNCLYNEHLKARNVWTISNKNFPLIRYTGCEFKIYRPKLVDAVINFQNCYPMEASQLTYLSTQPYISMMTKGSKIIRRLDDTKNKKPYKKFKFRPPQQMTNRWFFSADIANTGLIMLTSTSASLNNIYISPYAETNNITLKLLNCIIFQNRHFNQLTTSGYHPKDNMWLWAAVNGEEDPKIGDMIFLGNTVQYNHGTALVDLPGINKNYTDNIKTAMDKYINPKYWGNPFHEDNFNQKTRYYFTQASPQITLNTTTHQNKPLNTKISTLGFTRLHQEFYFTGRYNPNRDRAENNIVYFLKTTAEATGWDPDPEKDTLITAHFPLWVSVWGLLDYHEKLKDMQHMDTDYIMVIQSKAIEPQDINLKYYVVLDSTFTHGDSEWHEGHNRTEWDNIHWHPMLHYQHRSIENIGQSGPATAKLGPYKTEELHCEYKFYFKVGGCAPPMDSITDPTEQATFPVPTNMLETNSLQSPEQPIETYLYSFDERHQQITKTAAQRILKDFKPSTTLFTDPTTTGTEVPLLQKIQTQETDSETETQEETLLEQLIKQRRQQLRIKQRINQLIKQLTTTT